MPRCMLPGLALLLTVSACSGLPTPEASRVPYKVAMYCETEARAPLGSLCDDPNYHEVFRRLYAGCLRSQGY
jgi:hypothetical protein